MKFSYNWMREFVEGLDTPPESLERLITMKTAECEGVERMGGLLEGVLYAKVEKLPDKSPVFKAAAAPKDPKTGHTRTLDKWVLQNYLDVAKESRSGGGRRHGIHDLRFR